MVRDGNQTLFLAGIAAKPYLVRQETRAELFAAFPLFKQLSSS
jgi:hypothetical protein